MTYEKLEKAVDEFFNDRSRSAEETIDLLENLVEDIEVKIEALKG